MNAPRKGTSQEVAVRNVVSRLKDAEVNLLVAIRSGKNRRHSVLLVALVLVREALAALSGRAKENKLRRRAKTPHLPPAPGARFL
jgi:hypothetical protein